MLHELESLRLKLLAQYHGKPQETLRVEHALREVASGLAALASLGCRLHLAAGPPPEDEGWPRVLFHLTSAPNGRVVASRWDAEELGADWWPTLEEAQHSDGVKTQFAGRGGVRRRDLPMVIEAALPVDAAAERLRKDAMIAKWKEEQKK